ncbi:MAG: energy transducer TonB [Flavobacteriales bacterium]
MNPRIPIAVLTLFMLPSLFAQEEVIVSEPPVVQEPATDPDEPLTVVEVMPEFPGGSEALFKYMGKHVTYPEEAIENGVQGTVYVSFVIESDGRINEVKVLRGIGSGCDEEALRVVKSMPNWIPGTQRGKPVRVRYNLPIRFHL